MPLIAPVLPTLAAPSTETSAAAPATASSDSAPRFSDALSRAGQSQSAADNATNQAGAQGKTADAPPQANAQQSASADTRDSKTQARADDAQQTTQNAAAGDAAASAMALQTGGLLQAATATTQSGKNLPHDSRKAAAALVATPALTPGMMLNLAVTAQPAQAADAKKTSAAVAISAAPSPANLPDAAQQSGPLKSAQQNALPSAATPLTDHLPAWLQGAAGRGADASQLGSFVTLHSARAASADAATLATAQPARAEPAAATTAPGQLAPSIALTLPQGVQTPQAAAGATVQPPMGSPDWGQAMNQQVLFAAQGQQQFATLHLNPPQLGPLEVHLQLHDGQIQAQFVSPHAVVRQAVEAALPQLRDLFTGAGLSLMQTFVGTQGGQGERQQQARTQRGAARVSANSGAGAERSGAAAALPQRWQQGMVNTYV
ncbi:MAG: flagellar hook-length control protein FliK [Thiomonas sp.]|nr:flagellar hook-length control protein FliK [Thiomonas sp.]